MEWIDVEKELPKTRKRFLAICRNGYVDDESSWTGIVDVYFDPHTGWARCESQQTKPVFVTHYTEYPIPQ